MKTVILCGGFGTRIRDVTEDIPKPMIPIGDFPILWHIMKYYSCFDHKDFILCLGHKGNVVKEFFLNYYKYTQDFTINLGDHNNVKFHGGSDLVDWNVTLAETGLKAMTGARVQKIKKYVVKDDVFMLTYGDGVGNVDLKKLYEFHKSHGKIMTVTGVRPPGRFGEIAIDSKGSVIEFNEKPQTTSGLINGGFFICNKEIFNYLDDSEDLVFEKGPMNNLVNDNQMMLFEHDGFWQPMDTYREYSLLNNLYNKGEAPWAIWK
ncbi:MAG: glucose-1-phosphate cytidylyltransferase [bacterium]